MEPVRKTIEKPLEVRVSGKAKKMPVVDTDGRFKTKNKKHDAKITKKLNIQDFSIEMLYIHISWHMLPVGRLSELSICRQQYEQWLENTGKLDWYMEGYDGEGGMEPMAGTMAIDDYWENAEYEVKRADLLQYIMKQNII